MSGLIEDIGKKMTSFFPLKNIVISLNPNIPEAKGDQNLPSYEVVIRLTSTVPPKSLLII